MVRPTPCPIAWIVLRPIANCAKRGPHYDNVYLAHQGAATGKLRLIAMDHNYCFTSGHDLTPRLADIDCVRDEGIYGLFPAFVPLMDSLEVKTAADRLHHATAEVVRPMVQSIPHEWDVPVDARNALVQLVAGRAAYLADRICDKIKALCWPQDGLFEQPGGAS